MRIIEEVLSYPKSLVDLHELEQLGKLSPGIAAILMAGAATYNLVNPSKLPMPPLLYGKKDYPTFFFGWNFVEFITNRKELGLAQHLVLQHMSKNEACEEARQEVYGFFLNKRYDAREYRSRSEKSIILQGILDQYISKEDQQQTLKLHGERGIVSM